MYSCVAFSLFVLVKYCDAYSEAHYECGPHGRFEYCIDGIPGCVVGCHCHPGYYFDTETKICEPNIKLARDYRRHQSYDEPTRVPTERNPEPFPTPTTKSPVDEKLEAIDQDADDLGDWLYNQFFKTIENQVINKTDEEPLTRRSGSQPQRQKSARRSHKRPKKSSRRKRIGKSLKRKKGLKKKLLRITEDDSLFDSSSSSEESDYEDDMSFESDRDSWEITRNVDVERDRDHGHRKILMINKKPTPPLPSFIFLPNVDTPFYPPIGLPPPPIVPMYPMVPIPPVGPIFGPQVTPCPTQSTTTTDRPTTDRPTTKAPDDETTTEPPTSENETEEPSTAEPDAETTEAPPHSLRAWGAQGAKAKNQPRSNAAARHRLMKFRNKMKKKMNKMATPAVQNNIQNMESPLLNNLEAPMQHPQIKPRPAYDEGPPIDEVDFKYLSELIHKADINKTAPEKFTIPVPDSELNFPKINPPLPSRRNYQSRFGGPPEQGPLSHRLGRPPSIADDVNESYYSNLGKEIASLIRKIDGGAKSKINIDIEQNRENPMQPMFEESRYSPRSYWERFVRSPLIQRQTNDERTVYTKYSSEDLLNLEDQVNVATAVERVLSLQELENIANVVATARKPITKKHSVVIKLTRSPPPKTYSKHFNINLLPPVKRKSNQEIVPREKSKKQINKYDKAKANLIDIFEPNMFSVNHYKSYSKNIPVHKTYNITKQSEISTAKNLSSENILTQFLNSPVVSPLHHQVSKIVQRNMTTPRTTTQQNFMKYQLKPMSVNYKSGNYINNNRNQYRTHHVVIPIPMFSKHKIKSTGTNIHPSYFHHEFHHFDYFD